jgi:predicted nucleotidyltransferase
VFGSRTRGQARFDSDIDIAVLVQESGDVDEKGFNWLTNGDRWQDSLCELLPVKVDLQMIGDDDLVVRPSVADHGILIFRRNVKQ